jgi:Zn-dependent peptidase ImmA (M78 family)
VSKREIPEYSVAEIERKAAEILRRFNVPGDYVEIEVIAEKHLSLEIISVPKIGELYETEGILWKTGTGDYKVVIDERLMDYNPNRYRFTVAEEAAHFILHKEFFDAATTIEEAADLQDQIANYEFADRNAKRLAAAVLMPPERLKRDAARYYSQIVALVGYGDLAAVKKKLTSVLAKQYQVSSQAMEIRLGERVVNLRDKIENALAKHRPRIE